MNANIPTLRVWVSRTFLTGGQAPGIEEGYAFAIQSIRGRALAFHVMLKTGAHFRGVPLHVMLTHDSGGFEFEHDLEDLQLWDCFSCRPVVTVFDYLRDHQCKVWLRTRQVVKGQYRFTVDWMPDSEEAPGLVWQVDQNKCAHVIELENGQLAAMPTNRVAWTDAYFIGNDPHPESQGYRTNETVWQAETCEKWSVAEKTEVYY